MIKRTLHYIWGKKFALLLLALVLILLPNTIGRDMQIRSTTVITEMTIARTADEIQITAQKFKTTAGADSINYETVTFHGTDVRAMLANTSLAHCTSIKFDGDPDLAILHDLYHYKDLRGNTKVNDTDTIGALLKNRDNC